MSTIPSLWFLTNSDKEKTTEELKRLAHNEIMVRLKSIIQKRLQELESNERKEDTYDNHSWAYLQSHRNGRAQELKFLLDILSFVN